MHTEWAPASPVPSGGLDAGGRPADGLGRTVPLDHDLVHPLADPQEALATARRFSGRLKLALIGSDVVAVAAGLALATLIYQIVAGADLDQVTLVALVSLPVWPVLFAQQGLYQARRIDRRMEELRRVINAVIAGILVLAGISVLLQSEVARGWLAFVAAGRHRHRLPGTGAGPPHHPRVPPPGRHDPSSGRGRAQHRGGGDRHRARQLPGTGLRGRRLRGRRGRGVGDRPAHRPGPGSVPGPAHRGPGPGAGHRRHRRRGGHHRHQPGHRQPAHPRPHP